MSIVIDLNLVCVICLQDGELTSVFERDDTSKMRISEKIMKCSELKLDEESKLPDKICYQCTQDLAATYRFQQNCEMANSVFRTIQQQEDALATYELEQQKIKIPSGLKIKRIKTENTTYVMPVQVDQAPTSMVPTVNEIDFPVTEETMEQLPVDEDKLDVIDLDEYYETEEVLEDNTDEEVLEIKVEKQISSRNEIEKPQDLFEHEDCDIAIQKNEIFVNREEIKVKKEMLPEGNTLPPQQNLPKRGRGRPKKLTNDTIERSTSGSLPSILDENENSNQKEYLTASSSDEKSSVLKQIAVEQKTRKRSSLSPDAKPTKICDICGNSYKYQHALNAHMRRHNNDRPFNCEFCDKAFVSAVELRRHMRVHTGHKPYACQYCDRRFSDFGSRIKHERTHTGERPYICATCGKTFAYAHVLSVHLRTHTGEKKFKCLLCGKGFTKKAYLKTHTEQHVRAASFPSADPLADPDGDRGGIVAIKDVALEECIFTTEYIDDEDDAESVTTTSAIQMNEEHLELEDNDQADNYEGTVTYIKHIKSDDQSSCDMDA